MNKEELEHMANLRKNIIDSVLEYNDLAKNHDTFERLSMVSCTLDSGYVQKALKDCEKYGDPLPTGSVFEHFCNEDVRYGLNHCKWEVVGHESLSDIPEWFPSSFC